MNRRAVLFAAAVSAVVAGSSAGAAPLPNIVLILADDMGVGDVSAMRAGGSVSTPNIDDIAKRGVVFDGARAPASVCSPTRYALLTGQHMSRTWLRDGVLKPYGSALVGKGQWTLARFLRRQGYNTVMVGKHHLGIDWWTKSGGVAVPEQRGRDWQNLALNQPYRNGPLDLGFDAFFGVDAPNYPPYAWIRGRKIVGRLTAWKGPEQYGIDGLAVPGWDVQQVFRRLTREAVAQVERYARWPKPFFAYLSLTGPHTPITPRVQFRGRSGVGPYGDYVLEIDHLVGRIRAALSRAGELRDTIFIVTSDNGSPARIDDNSPAGSLLARHRANGPYRGLKAGAYEGGLRVPLIISWPAGGLDGRNEQVVSLIDLAPTIADLIGRPLRSRQAAPDAVSFAALLDPALRPTRKGVADLGDLGVSLTGTETITWSGWKLIDHADGPELFDLRADPQERRNLAAERPGVVREMVRRLRRLREGGWP